MLWLIRIKERVVIVMLTKQQVFA